MSTRPKRSTVASTIRWQDASSDGRLLMRSGSAPASRQAAAVSSSACAFPATSASLAPAEGARRPGDYRDLARDVEEGEGVAQGIGHGLPAGG
jgi:hypothetical protein